MTGAWRTRPPHCGPNLARAIRSLPPPMARPDRFSRARDSGVSEFRHDVFRGVGVGAENSRSRSGNAASRSQSSMLRKSLAVWRAFPSARSRWVSSTAHARTYRSSWSASSSVRAITNSSSLSSSSRARCRATQSHCRHRWEQNCFGRPLPARSGSTRRHHRHRSIFVMTKW